jgi:hemerythrin-like domain-containing protein
MEKRSGDRKVEAQGPLGGKGSGLFALLHQEHQRTRELLDRLGASAPTEVGTRQALFKQLEQDLLTHMEAEERFLYSELEQREAARPRTLEAFEEHLAARNVLGTFTSLAVDDERWGPKLRVLDGLLRQHMDAEEDELFVMARELLRPELLEEIEARVWRQKEEAAKAQQARVLKNARGGGGADAV